MFWCWCVPLAIPNYFEKYPIRRHVQPLQITSAALVWQSNAGSGCAAARLGGYRAPCASTDRIRAPANTPPDRNGGWLDLIAADFFGDALKRGPDQSDAAFRQRIRARLFGERATRAGLIQA